MLFYVSINSSAEGLFMYSCCCFLFSAVAAYDIYRIGAVVVLALLLLVRPPQDPPRL